MDGTSTPTATEAHGPGEGFARDPWPLLLEIRNEQRFLRHTLEILLRKVGQAGPGPRPGPHEPPELRGRREARGLAVIRRAMARRDGRAGGQS